MDGRHSSDPCGSEGRRCNDKKGSPEETCQSCLDTVKDDDNLRLVCRSGHILCGECSAVFADSVLVQHMPEPKCSLCRAPIPSLAFQRILKKEQLETYLTYVAMHTLSPGERLVTCVNCNYFQVRTDDPSLFFCQNEACGAVHCCGCNVTFPRIDDDEDDEEALMEHQAELEKHLSCVALRDEKAGFDKALADGCGRKCPGCGVAGRKDGMCTHMTCKECSKVWCYVCGLSVDDCDKATRFGSVSQEPIYGHNVDWTSNPKRCPIFLSAISEVDSEWDLYDEDEDEDFDEEDLEELCVDKFHKWRTLQKLKAFRDSIGEEKWCELRNTFRSVKNCGFEDDEIAEAGTTPLFTRPNDRSEPGRFDESVIDLTDSPLPENWEEMFDLDSGRMYYYNTVDRIRTWERPAPVIHEEQEPLAQQPRDQQVVAPEVSEEDPEASESVLMATDSGNPAESTFENAEEGDDE